MPTPPRLCLLFLLLLLRLGHARAGNPIVPGVGMADPHAHAWDDRHVYVYATHDFSPNNTGFRMDDWWVWRSTDLVAWERAGAALAPLAWEDAGARTECWATDAAQDDQGNTFWYLSVGPTQVAVVKSTSGPAGPWQDVLGEPLLSSALGKSLTPPTEIRDPSVFRDPKTGDAYLFFGTFNYYVARLNADMVSLAEPPRAVQVVDALGSFGPGKTDDKPFVHFSNATGGRYYLSWGCFYGVADNPRGPYTYRGTVIDVAHIADDFQIPDGTTPDKWWAGNNLRDRHGSFLEFHGQTYFFANDRSHSSDKANPAVYRDVVAGFVHYYGNGSIAPVEINKVGVGQYDLSSRIEAENFFRLAAPRGRGRKAEGRPGTSGAFVVSGLGFPGSMLEFPHVHGLADAVGLWLVGGGEGGGGDNNATVTATVRADGEAAASCRLPSGVAQLFRVLCALNSELMLRADVDEVHLTLEFASSATPEASEGEAGGVFLDYFEVERKT